MRTVLSLGMLASILLFAVCAPFPSMQPRQKSNLTMGMVKSKIIKGETTQAEILELLGAPNLITKNKDNDEVWNYNRMSVEKGGAAASDIWLGSRALSSTTTSSFDLIITFDESDVVKDYSVISASY